MRPVTLSESDYAALLSDDCGVCLECGDTTRGGTEPDAQGYRCDRCGALAVMGAESALVAGHLQIVDGGAPCLV